jgi:hypothetical protein
MNAVRFIALLVLTVVIGTYLAACDAADHHRAKATGAEPETEL